MCLCPIGWTTWQMPNPISYSASHAIVSFFRSPFMRRPDSLFLHVSPHRCVSMKIRFILLSLPLFICPLLYKSPRALRQYTRQLLKSLTSDFTIAPPCWLLFSNNMLQGRKGATRKFRKKQKNSCLNSHVCLNCTKKDCRLDTTIGWIVGVCRCNTMTQI